MLIILLVIESITEGAHYEFEYAIPVLGTYTDVQYLLVPPNTYTLIYIRPRQYLHFEQNTSDRHIGEM